jgi:hypothetical protein
VDCLTSTYHFLQNPYNLLAKKQKANVQSVNCKAEKCIVKILIDAKIKFGSGFGSAETSSVLKEQWIQSLAAEGWYHFSNQ